MNALTKSALTTSALSPAGTDLDASLIQACAEREDEPAEQVHRARMAELAGLRAPASRVAPWRRWMPRAALFRWMRA